MRETFYAGYLPDENDWIPEGSELQYWYFADTRSNSPGDVSDEWCFHMYGNDKSLWPKWKPSIHMPKEAARIFPKIINIRLERLFDISESDAIKPLDYWRCLKDILLLDLGMLMNPTFSTQKQL